MGGTHNGLWVLYVTDTRERLRKNIRERSRRQAVRKMAYDQLNQAALVVTYTGLFGWLGSTAMFIIRGFRSNGQARFGKALFWFMMIFIMLAVWIAGLVFLGFEA